MASDEKERRKKDHADSEAKNKKHKEEQEEPKKRFLTRPETRSFLREKYYRRKDKILLAIAILIIFLALFGVLSYAISITNPILILISAFMLVFFFTVAVFLVDQIYYEHE